MALNQPEELMRAIDSDHPKHVFDAVLDGTTPVKVLVVEANDPNFPGAVIPVAVLLTDNLYERVQPTDATFEAESTEKAEARIRAMEGDVA